MRIYPTADVNVYQEKEELWTAHCRNPNKSWRIKPLQPVHPILHWRDLEGARKKEITLQDLYFEDWPKGRIRPEACLPIYYCMGHGFIRLERRMGGFKCTPMPISLKQARVVRVKEMIQDKANKQKEAEEKKKEKEEAKKQKEKEKAEKAKMLKEGKLDKDKPKKEPKGKEDGEEEEEEQG